MHNQTAHSLNSVNHFNVYKTIDGGERLAQRELLRTCKSYVFAQDFKRELCNNITWAIVTAVYADGCESEPF